MQVYLIRHTRVGIEKGICYGQTDVSLASSFEEEAEYYHQLLPNDFDAVYSSPLSRCVQLANRLDRGHLILDIRLKEIDFGQWENQRWEDLQEDDLKIWSENLISYKAHQGENLLELNQRVISFIEECLQKEHSKVLIVTHAGVIRCFWQYILQFPVVNTMKIPICFEEVFVADLQQDSTQNWIIQKC